MAQSQGFHQVVSLFVATLVIAFGIGCSSSNKPAPAGGVTSVDQSKQLSSLSASEMQTLCNDFKNYLVQKTSQDFAARSCMQSALVASGLSDPTQASQACHTAYDDCMAPSNPQDSSGITINSLCPSSPAAPSCSMTVSQYIDCLNQLIPAAQAAWALTVGLCDNLTSCSGTCNSPLSLPTACAQVNTTCPGLTPQVTYTTPG